MKLLHLDSSITGDNSVSRQLSAAIVGKLRAADPSLEVSYRDLVAEPIEHLTLGHLPAASPESRALLDQFLASDTVVIGVPMYNFTLPSQLKAWLDRIFIAGETFSYGPEGPQGLAGDKRLIVALSRGGLYGAGSPVAAFEHAETYLKAAFGFIGITPEFVLAEGVAMGPDQRTQAIDGATGVIERLAA
ncbi:MAG TPA: FMN-dependent NADH-azoreductase [Sphingomonas sp.]|uniref:FMN-dependent NADH-azoreductase n=1 Tax=Sphingomonas sp. TaxID=28214 RepID=UPI002CCE791D|nr:FMN-dependent NADH-azoreductase [Sphingomonas sp.]HMI18177.1 FMN-dependent NADH-azoreductase [Sphingomonas sp.]